MQSQSTEAPRPAGLRVRCAAFGFDYLLITAYLIPLVLAGALLDYFSSAQLFFGGPYRGQAAAFLLITAPVTLYFALSDAGKHQATWGKRRMGLLVTDLDGRRLSCSRSLGRTLLKFVPWELSHACIWQLSFASDQSSPVFTIGFAAVWLMVGGNVVSILCSDRRQALYDRLAGTLVVRP